MCAETPNERHWLSTGSMHFSTCTTLNGGMILGYFEEIPGDKRFKFTANALFMVILYMIILNCIFVLWVGLYGR